MYKLIIFLGTLFLATSSYAQNKGTFKADSIMQEGELVKDPAEFKLGKAEMINFFKANLKYPEKAIQDGIEGKVVVRFLVDEEGIISEIGIIKRLSIECDNEAIRLVKAMPRWSPARNNNNEIVEMSTSVTIDFILPK